MSCGLLMTLVALLKALATGRLPSFSLPFVDAELPGDPEQTLDKDGNVQPSCEYPPTCRTTLAVNIHAVAFWKATWGKECVSAVVEVTLTSRAPKYSLILELDRKIRDMPLPNYALEKPPKGASLSATMKHFMPLNYRELSTILRSLLSCSALTHTSPSPALRAPLLLRAGAQRPPKGPAAESVRAVIPGGLPQRVRARRGRSRAV